MSAAPGGRAIKITGRINGQTSVRITSIAAVGEIVNYGVGLRLRRWRGNDCQ
jgi:hypothetical protein